jgi:hypothetical protein
MEAHAQTRFEKLKAATDCRCPLRPYYTLGSFGSGSSDEDRLLDEWQRVHGEHPYAKARDEVARQIQWAVLKRADAERMVRELFGDE